MSEAHTMTTITPAYEKLFSEKIEQLVQDIACCFAPARLDYIWQIVEGPDAVDAMRSGGMLAGKAAEGSECVGSAG